MERTAILAMMDELKLSGMRAAYDEILAGATRREHAPARVVGDLLKAEIAEKQARSIKYQLTLARLGQGRRRLRLCRHARERDPGARSGHRRVPGRAAQRRPDRRHRVGFIMPISLSPY